VKIPPSVAIGLAWAAAWALPSPQVVAAQSAHPTPVRQSELATRLPDATPLTLRDASRDDRWMGLGVRDVRWAPDGAGVYFRWHRDPAPGQVEEADPWFLAAPDGSSVREASPEDVAAIPGEAVDWSPDGRMAVWERGGSVYLYQAGATPSVRAVATLSAPARSVRFAAGGGAVDFEVEEALYRYDVGRGSVSVIARVETVPADRPSAAGRWLEDQQRELLGHVREAARLTDARERVARLAPGRPQSIPVPAGTHVDQMVLSPDGRHLSFRARTPAGDRPPTEYVDYVDPSGYSTVHRARSKVGESRDTYRLGIIDVDPSRATDGITVRWVDISEAEEATVPHGLFWNLEGTRAVAQFIGESHRDLWIAEVDPATGEAAVLVHDHDDAWIGGPPIQANYLQPTLLEWLPGDRFVFASERSGWSHLHRVDPGGGTRALTEGAWEVRSATLSRDRTWWLLQGSREHPADDHLYRMPAGGGALTRLTDGEGRRVGYVSPDGTRLALLSDDATHMPDLWVGSVPGSYSGEWDGRRVTVSGSDAFWEHPLVAPEIVSFPHPDGENVWGAVYRPREPNPERAAVIHVHGGGYRQFAHRGWTVYGYALHLGFINYMVQQGYTVMDFDYRGGAGFGRDYRTDIARAMGISDVDGAVAAARYLVREEGVDSTRIGMYGVSYGGFMTLMSQFRYPGVFAAGVARAAVSDWAHYSDGWTSRILGVPHMDEEAYRVSSPIYHAEGLEDRLLITHGLVDDNVHFQDAARLIQRLVELEKEFEVMVYPVEPHTIATEASRYDLVRRQAAFFDRWLRGR